MSGKKLLAATKNPLNLKEPPVIFLVNEPDAAIGLTGLQLNPNVTS